MSRRVVDFDAARRERGRQPVTLIVGGEEYHLGAGLPAGIALDMMRFAVVEHAEGAEGEHDCDAFGCVQTDELDIPKDEVPGLLERLFGEANWSKLVDRVDITELPELLELTVRALNGSQDDGLPNREARRAMAKARGRGSAGSRTGR